MDTVAQRQICVRAFVYIGSRQTHVLEQGRDPVQLQHMLLPHVALELLHTLMRLQIPDGCVASPNG